MLGELITDSYAHYVFAEDTKVLWTAPAKGETLVLPGENAPCHCGSPFSGKLKGAFNVPFSLLLPEAAELAGSTGALMRYRLPCSYSPRFSVVTITYRIFTIVTHNSLLKPNHT